MDEAEKKKRVQAFSEKWLAAEGRENGETQPFWLELLHDVLGAPREGFPVVFEKPVKVGSAACRIDVFLPTPKVIIEQKGKAHALDAKGGDGLTPFEQARNYAQWLTHNEHPEWIITCNFSEFWIYDMKEPNPKPQILLLKDLPKELYRLQFLVGEKEHVVKEEEVSVAAGKIVGRLYDCLHARFNNPNSPESLRALNILCVRLVFCLYAENAGIFPKYGIFHDYLADFDAPKTRRALLDLFKILNTPEENRDPYLKDDNPTLATFPYVNGGLFADDSVEIPSFDDTARTLLLDEASSGFNWRGISPTIFGAVFESTLNTETRRKGGMHYTSPTNIHKVIDPLFLDDLTAQLEEIERLQATSPQRAKKRASEFQDKLASIKFLDPACGSGNFLTETYLSLRKLENRAIKLTIDDGQTLMSAVANPIKVSISQFYGIEINDFAVSVAKTAMWIAESQMLEQTEDILGRQNAGDFLPLKRYANIAEGNALKMDWSRLEVESGDLWHHASQQAQEHTPREAISYDYIFGNPPFVGFNFMGAEQKKEMNEIFPGVKNLDYVCAWYKKADSVMDENTEAAFVSTNSITQGETVSRFWKFVPDYVINFAHRTFKWDSESNDKAHVHCVIVGFAKKPRSKRYIFDGDTKTEASNINAYLMDAPNILVESRTTPLCNVPKMVRGNKPADGGHLIIEADEYDEFLKKEPCAAKFVKKFIGSVEFINGKKRWCLWLDGASPSELRALPEVMKRVELCKKMRENSVASAIRKFAETPTLFAQRTQPMDKDFVVVPVVSSERRRYVPMEFLKSGTVCSDRLQLIPDATLFHFGVLTSDVHMAWMRVIGARLKSDYSYSSFIVYNNFPWASADEEQIQKISDTAQGILDARAKFPDSTLADLYDELTMPKELRDAHSANDKAVRKLFGFSATATEPEIVRELFQRYSALAAQK